MSDGLNKQAIIGNLGADPELRFTQGGTAVLNMRLAATTSYLDSDKKQQERTEWFSVVVWGKRGEGLAKILSKGDKLYVDGETRTSSYEKEGVKHYRSEVHANEIILMGGKGAGGKSERDDRKSDRGSDDDRRESSRDDRRDSRRDDRKSDEKPRGRAVPY
jgi:single-strand DNA-binding protein